MLFLKFRVQQASCLYLMVTAQAVTATPEASDLLFRKLGLDVNFRTCMSQNCIMFICKLAKRVISKKNSGIKHIHAHHCLLNPSKKAAVKSFL